MKYCVLFAALGGIGLTSCGKKEEEVAPKEAEVEEVAVVAAEETPPPAPSTAKPTDRAAALGFAKFLPADTHAFLGFYDGQGFVEELRGSKLGKFVEEMAAGEGVDLDELTEMPEAQMGLALFKEEFFLSIGKGAPKQTSNAMGLQAAQSFHQMKTLVALAAGSLEGGDIDEEEMMEGSISGLLSDPKIMGTVLDSVQMPPVLFGWKLSDEEMRGNMSGMIAGQLAQILAMVGPEGEDFAEGIEIPNGETPLTGLRVVGEKVVAKMREEGNDEDLRDITDEANAERLLKALTKKNLVIATGVVGDYLVIFLGSDADEFQLAESPEKSLVGSGEFSFVDGFLGKKLMMVGSFTKPLLDSLGTGETGLGNMARGLKAGLAETEAFGDTQDLEVLLDLVQKQEKAIIDAIQYSPAGWVLYREKGYKLETFGGSSRPELDLDSEHQFGKLADLEGTLLYAAGISDEAYTQKSLDYLDTLGETLYLAGKKISVLEVDDHDFNQFKEGFAMFDGMFSSDLLQLWKALRDDVGAGMGGETAIVIDLKGGLPTAPGLAKVLIDEATAPRFAFVAPVTDREKLGSAWDKINGSLENVFKTVSEIGGLNIPMQRPMTSEKDDLTTWFFNVPFQTDEFVFSASIDSSNFYATTSKSFTKELSALLKEGGSKQKGAHLRLDFQELLTYINETLALVEKNKDEVFAGNEGAAEGFQSALPQIKEILGAMDELKNLQVHTRKEGGRVRSSVHLNVE